MWLLRHDTIVWGFAVRGCESLTRWEWDQQWRYINQQRWPLNYRHILPLWDDMTSWNTAFHTFFWPFVFATIRFGRLSRNCFGGYNSPWLGNSRQGTDTMIHLCEAPLGCEINKVENAKRFCKDYAENKQTNVAEKYIRTPVRQQSHCEAFLCRTQTHITTMLRYQWSGGVYHQPVSLETQICIIIGAHNCDTSVILRNPLRFIAACVDLNSWVDKPHPLLLYAESYICMFPR